MHFSSFDEIDAEEYEECAANRIDNISDEILIEESGKYINYLSFLPISGQVNTASATETVDLGSIPGRVKPKTIKINIHVFSS